VSVILETMLCGILLTLYYRYFSVYGEAMYNPWTDFSEFRRTAVVVMMCFALSATAVPTAFYYRNVRAFQILHRVVNLVLLYAILSSLVISLGDFSHLSVGYRLTFWLLLIVTLFFERLVARASIRMWRRRPSNVQYTVMVGSRDNNLELLGEMKTASQSGYKVIGYFDDKPRAEFDAECPYLGTLDEVLPYLSSHPEVRCLFCALPSVMAEYIRSLISYCENHVVYFYSVPNVRNYLHHRMTFHMLGSVPFLSLRSEPLRHPFNRFVKRTFDIVVSLVFLIGVFWIIAIVVAIITKITMPGPVFFRQKRNGLNGREFYCIKFRSMRVNADADRVQATKDDPRKTRWGEIMRHFNIDELPQFINVLLGDMSVVGPRPHMLLHTEQYSKLIDKYMVRHFVKPGITGWSQVMGFRGETRELKEMEDRIRGDIYYIEHWTLELDLFIMYKTVANVFKGEENAY
jgi:putative colanic acid biosynthesis UDP-glucose lipid carrier transferase